MGDVVLGLQKLDKILSTDEIHDAVSRLERRGQVSLSEEKIRSSFARDLADIEANGPFWIAIIACAAVVLATFALPQTDPWIAAKRIAGAVFLFVIPGYVMTNVFIARNRLSYLERIAVSVGLSLAAVAIIGIVLSYSIAGVRLEPIVISIASFNVVLAFFGAYRDFLRRHGARLSHHKFLRENSASR